MEFSIPRQFGTESFGKELAASFLLDRDDRPSRCRPRAHRKRGAARFQESSFGGRRLRMGRRSLFLCPEQPRLKSIQIDVDDRRCVEGENL
jgi:hypothetical protein